MVRETGPEGDKKKDSKRSCGSSIRIPKSLAFFMRFLRRYFDVPDEAVRVACNLFADHEERQRAIEDFWLETAWSAAVVHDEDDRSTTTRAQASGRATNRLPYGTCRVTVHRTRVVQHIYGAIQEYGGFDRPEWLD